jgi:Ca-activated chloride channel homolog
MARHRAQRGSVVGRWALVALVVVGLVVGAVVLVARNRVTTPVSAAASGCAPAVLRVVTAASFAPALEALGPALAADPGCTELDVVVADGRTAAARAAEVDADVWIPDDGAWAGDPGELELATDPVAHAGATVAVSPFYLVTDPATADRVTGAGGGWLGLAGLVEDRVATLAIRDPAGSGDGLLAAGAVGEAVWVESGMNASTEALAEVEPGTRTVPGPEPALPQAAGEVGVVPEHALIPALRDGAVAGARILAPADHTSALRYSWHPTAAAVADPSRAPLLERLRRALTGPGSSTALAAAGLRSPGTGMPPESRPGQLPLVQAPLFDVLGEHEVDHVFATWYAEDRRSDVLMVVDVSGSMGAVAPGSDRALIELVRDGAVEMTGLLPDDSRLGLWEFGVQLAPPVDHRVLLDQAPLGSQHREAAAAAMAELVSRKSGSGVHDTVLAAYLAARDGYRDGVPNHVMVFTDGQDEADPGALTLQQLVDQLAAARDPQRPVQVSIVTFGDREVSTRLADALDPVGIYVDHLTRAEEVRAVFLHAAAGGLHG